LWEESFLIGNSMMWTPPKDQIDCPACKSPVADQEGVVVPLKSAGYLHISIDWVCDETWTELEANDEKIFAPIPPKPFP
jgi:hypothetical protein